MFGGNDREGGNPDERNAVEVLIGGTPATAPDAYRLTSPAALLPLGVPTLLVQARSDLDVPVASVVAYAARAVGLGDTVETLLFDEDELTPDVPGHFAIITPTLGDAGGWPKQVMHTVDVPAADSNRSLASDSRERHQVSTVCWAY